MATTQAPALAIESNFNPKYEVPVSEATPDEQAEFSQSLKDIIGEIEQEYAPAPEPEVEDEVPAETEPEAEVQPETEVEEPAITKGIERLVQRETAIAQREATLQAREAQMTTRMSALEQENTELRGRLPNQSVQELLFTDPAAAFKAMGHNPETVVQLSIAQQLKAQGKPVPEALAKVLEKAETNRKIESLERALADRENAERMTAYFNTVAMGAREYVKTEVGKSKDLPTLTTIAKSDPDRVHSEILEEITRDAHSRMAKDPNGEPLSYADAARKVEARYAPLAKLLVQTNAPDAKLAQVKPNTPPPQKPPTKPLQPWKQNADNIEAQGLNDAIREFHKLETARKAKR
jgi:hypothetical protein